MAPWFLMPTQPVSLRSLVVFKGSSGGGPLMTMISTSITSSSLTTNPLFAVCTCGGRGAVCRDQPRGGRGPGRASFEQGGGGGEGVLDPKLGVPKMA